MFNYTSLSKKVKNEFFTFWNLFFRNLGRVEKKLILNISFGFLVSKSVLLSKISDALNEKISKKKTIERLSNGLNSFSKFDVIASNQAEVIKDSVTKDTVFAIDTTDFNKQFSKKMEDIGLVRDASVKGAPIVKGYYCEELVMINGKNHPISTQSEIYSNRDKDGNKIEGQKKDTILKVLENNFATYGNLGIYTLDRGYDDNDIFKFFVSNNINFVCRLKKNRNIVYKKKTMNVTKVIRNSKKKCEVSLNYKGKNLKVSASHKRIKIDGKQYNLIACYGLLDDTDKLAHDKDNDPFLLLTNLKIKNRKDLNRVIITYVKRWKIEEFFRCKKDEFDFENFRIRSLNGIKTLNQIVNISLMFLSLLSDKNNENEMVAEIIKKANGLKPVVRFWLYRVSEGIKNIFIKTEPQIVKSYFEWKESPKYRKFRQVGLFDILNA